MKVFMTGLLSVLLTTSAAWAADQPVELQTDEQKLSYVMGLDLGEYFKGLDEKFDFDILNQGIVDAYSGKKPLIAKEEADAIQKGFAQRQQQRQIKAKVTMIQKNRLAADTFLKENKSKEGVTETESGLQYKVVKKGEGAKPLPTDTVKVNYKGTLLDGTEFDSSYKRNEPAVFQVNKVIHGWQEALPLMPVGSTYELFIPPDLAYGDRGAPPVIEPGSMLKFEVELLEIIKPAEEQPKAKADQ
ncbi:FKBP-type peptidyl-prolyl cis-trans isomerase [Desulfobulbus rhabdoformis]|uniref:FKBP-type peptidyl-prolyl cis-trans isomerase n=1 Tax=Desulfobulbus rhabdoformis TaxID=34032 RepID=UPI0019643705|nr:FKBP-type peptidyl-prolyl cis-trans isomerase [Desulfobulbus rhabdoformis]MBM9614734.1 FKBP-type peptidyl-prolyl cis-trans isomerase [Desulfobulbus rhabdoformis]